MIQFVQSIFQCIMQIALFRMTEENFKISEVDDDGFIKTQQEQITILKEMIKKMTDLLKSI